MLVWQRPEVGAAMQIIKRFAKRQLKECPL